MSNFPVLILSPFFRKISSKYLCLKLINMSFSGAFGAGLLDLLLCLWISCSVDEPVSLDSVRFNLHYCFVFVFDAAAAFDCLLIKRHAQNTIKILKNWFMPHFQLYLYLQLLLCVSVFFSPTIHFLVTISIPTLCPF